MNIDDIRESADRYKAITESLYEQLSALKRECAVSPSKKAELIALRLEEQIKKTVSVTECLKRYCDDCMSAEQELVIKIKRKLFIGDRNSLHGKIIIENDIKRMKSAVLHSHVLVHDEWLDGLIIKNMAEDTDL